jgi:hypothetical protein
MLILNQEDKHVSQGFAIVRTAGSTVIKKSVLLAWVFDHFAITPHANDRFLYSYIWDNEIVVSSVP